MSKILTYIVVILALSVVSVSAGTVTLTGTCNKQSSVNLVNFTLSNSGNESAQQLALSPVITGATPQNGTYYLSSLAAGGGHEFDVALQNVTAKGSYSDYFILAYEQGSSTFTAVFLCALDFGNVSQSQVYVTANVTQSGNVDVVNASVFNAGSSPVTANVSLIVPPAFTYTSTGSSEVSLDAYQRKNVVFTVALPTSGQEFYQGAAAAGYENDGVHYSSLDVITLSNLPQSSSVPGLSIQPASYWFAYGVAIVIAALLLLILRSKMKKRRQPEQPEAQV